MKRRLRTFPKRWLLLLILLAMAVPMLHAQPAGPSGGGQEGSVSLWDTIRSGGLIGWIIIALSFVTVGLVVDHFLRLKEARLIPARTVAEVKELIKPGKIADAVRYCKLEDSLISRVVGAGLPNISLGYDEVRTAMEEEGRKQLGRLHQRVSYLNLIGVVSPMLGLLGTVMGMISSFNTLALSSATVKPAQLAGGISMALVTTLLGLIVAIPALFFFHFFENRLATITAEVETTCEGLLRPVKLAGRAASRPAPAPSAVAEGGAGEQ